MTMTMTSNIKSIARVLISHGETFHGGCADQVAAEWDGYGFNADEVDEWCEAEVWDAATAGALHEAGMRPRDVRKVNRRMIEDNGSSVYTSGCPTYSVCNGDLSVKRFLKAWRAMQAE